MFRFFNRLKIHSDRCRALQPARACRSARVVWKPKESPSEEAGRKQLLRPNCSDTHGFAGQMVWENTEAEKPLIGRHERSVDRQGDRGRAFLLRKKSVRTARRRCEHTGATISPKRKCIMKADDRGSSDTGLSERKADEPPEKGPYRNKRELRILSLAHDSHLFRLRDALERRVHDRGSSSCSR